MVVVEQLATLPAAGIEGIAPAAVSFPQTSLAGAAAPSAVWVPPPVRVRADGEGLVLAEDRDRGRVALHPLGSGAAPAVLAAEPVVDLLPAPGGGGAWLLERGRDAGGPVNVLRRVDGDGKTAWRRTGRWTAKEVAWERLEGGLERLLGDEAGNALVVAERPRTAVARIDEDGELVSGRELAPPGAHPVADGAGRLAWIAVDADSGRPQWHVLGPDGEAARPAALPAGSGGPASTLVGLDAEGRAYLAEASELTCVRPGADAVWRLGIESAAVGADGSVLTAVSANGGLEVAEWRGGDEAVRRRLDVPRLGSGRTPAWRLIAALQPESFLLWGGEGGRGPGVIATVSSDGRIVDLTDPAPEDARLRGWWPAPAREWQVDGAGRAYLTVAGPDGVAILRLVAD